MIPFFTLMFTIVLMTTGVEHDGPIEVAAMTTIMGLVNNILFIYVRNVFDLKATTLKADSSYTKVHM